MAINNLSNPFEIEEYNRRQKEQLLQLMTPGQKANAARGQMAMQSPRLDSNINMPLSAKQQLAIQATQNADIPGMDQILGAKTTTLGTALAKTLAAGASSYYGRKDNAEKASVLTKALQAETNAIEAKERAALDVDLQERLSDDAFRTDQLKTDEQRDFEAINPNLDRNSQEYSDGFKAFMDQSRSRYQNKSTVVSKMEQWDKLNPDATIEERRNIYNLILSRFGTSTVQGVDVNVAGVPFVDSFNINGIDDLGNPVGQSTIPERSQAEIIYKQDVSEGERLGKLKAERSYDMGGAGVHIREARKLLNDKDNPPTASGIGNVADKTAALIGQSLEGADQAASLASVGALLVSKMPRMQGPQSDIDVQNYQAMAGRVGNPNIPISQRLAALETLEILLETYINPTPESGKSVITSTDVSKLPDPLGLF